jgi:hypothetical protein
MATEVVKQAAERVHQRGDRESSLIRVKEVSAPRGKAMRANRSARSQNDGVFKLELVAACQRRSPPLGETRVRQREAALATYPVRSIPFAGHY